MVAESPALAELEELEITNGRITRAAIPHLARLPRLVRFTGEQGLGGEGCIELLRAVPSLTRLVLWPGPSSLTGVELAVFLAAPEIARLRELDLDCNELTDRDLLAIARAPLFELERLGLDARVDVAAGLEAVFLAPQLARLTALELGGITPVDLGGLLESAFAASLQELGARHAGVDDHVLRRLMRLPALVRVRLGLMASDRSELAAVIPDVLT